MRIVTLAIAAMLAGAAGPTLAQDNPNAPGAVAPPQDAQTPPAAPVVPAAPSVAPQPAPPSAASPNPPKAPSAAEIVPDASKAPGTTIVPSAPKAPAEAKVPEQPQAPAKAETVPPSPPPGPPSRYVFNRVDAGYLRLDNNTGQVAFCSQHAAGWVCQAVPEDRAALEKEIARLQDEIAALKSEVAALHEPPAPRPPAELTPRSSERNDDSKQLREDLARARVAIENAWRRLVEMIVNLQKDMMRKG
jgi:cell division protein FtsB